MGDTKKDQDIQLPGGFFLPKRQLLRLSALILTMAVCVGVSIRYTGTVMNFDLKENPALYCQQYSNFNEHSTQFFHRNLRIV